MQSNRKNTTQVLTVSRTHARQNLPSLLDQVVKNNGPIFIDGKSKSQVVLISKAQYLKLFKRKFKKNPMYGMWDNRTDMKSSTNWVNKLREKESNKYGSISE